jgi:hypothetical protein
MRARLASVPVSSSFARRLGVPLLAISLLSGALPTTAFAQTKVSSGDAALAETLFRDAKALMQQEKYKDACPKLEESQRLDPGGGTQLTLALCYEGAGRPASAWAAFNEALSLAKRDNRPERVKIAQEKIDSLDPKVPYLTIVVPPEVASASPEVKRDGTVIRPTVWGTAMPLDPGEHVVEVTAAGKKKWSRKVTVTTDNLKITLKVGKLEDEGGDASEEDPKDAPPPPPTETKGSWKKPAGITLIVAGVVGVGVGGYFGFQALSKRKDADDICPARECPDAHAVSLVDESKSAATLSTVGVGVGLGLGLLGAVFLATAPSKPSPSAARANPSPAPRGLAKALGVATVAPTFQADSRGAAFSLGGSFLPSSRVAECYGGALVRRLRSLPLVFAAVLVAAVPALSLRPLAARADAAKSPLMELDAVKVGMKGYGLTVFKGTEPERFDIEVIGVLSKFRPNQDLILIKTPHERLNIAHTVAGMSGSPIYIDGKMIGAYAYGWQFGSEPIAGVTPIENMMRDLARPIPPEILRPLASPGSPPKRAGGKRADLGSESFSGSLADYSVRTHAKQLAAHGQGGHDVPLGTRLAPAFTPLMISGMGDRTAAALHDLFLPLGLETQQGGGGGGKIDPNAPTRFVDGGAIGVQMVRGDISMMGLGTVTRVEGDRLVAFGHPMMQGGITLLPTAIGKIHWILASEQRSFKIGEPVRPVGALINDQQASIVVDHKAEAPTFPLTVEVEGAVGAPKTTWNMEVALDRFLTPSLLGSAMGSTVESTVSERRDAMWEAKTKIHIRGYGVLEMTDFGVTQGSSPDADTFFRSRAVLAAGMVLNNRWETAVVDKVEMKMKIAFKRDLLTLRGATVLDGEVEAGQKARIQVKFWQFDGAEQTKVIDLPMPAELAGRDVDVELLPSWAELPELPSPENLGALIANLASINDAPDTLVATYHAKDAGVMFQGHIAKQLPPSMLDSLRPTGDSASPEPIVTTVRTRFPIGRYIDGRDRVRVRVRESLR